MADMNVEKFLLACAMIALLALSLIHSPDVAAEQGCPEGFMPNPVGAPGQPQCIQGRMQIWGGDSGQDGGIRGYNNSWGAIAYDASMAKVGIAENEKNRRRAIKAAIAHCKSKGATDCKEVMNYANGCAAVVWGEHPGSGGGIDLHALSGETLSEAVDASMRQCASLSVQGTCKVFYSGCSSPIPY
ncbi:DUF4189 domain-containing protein [Pseudomonas sp. CGJS7]|uniref:DUF4189 domain-containing protein n=1 Tax=Pseudomonas sp. CGJS7 TaxID=3109348 RepID=UPI00300B9432